MYELTKMLSKTVIGLAVMSGVVLGLNHMSGACEPYQIIPQSIAQPGPTGDLGQPEPEIDDELIQCKTENNEVILGCFIK
jgi:hypothetical protein